MIKYSLFFCFLLTTLPTADWHEFHMSKSVIAYSESDQAIQISLHIFLDDLEDALREQGVDKLFLCTKKEAATAEEELFKYLQQKLQFTINQQVQTYEFIGKEPSEDLQAVWCYLEIPNIDQVQEITVSNSILVEIFDDQKNIVNIVGPNKAKSYLIMSKEKLTERIQY